jgi:hypothetical protein
MSAQKSVGFIIIEESFVKWKGKTAFKDKLRGT